MAEGAVLKCAKKGCDAVATEEVRYLLRQTRNSAPIESPVIHNLCSEHGAEIVWANVYNEQEWIGMQKNYVDNGFMPPLVELSCLEIRPMKKPNGK